MEVPCGDLGGVGADYRLSFGGQQAGPLRNEDITLGCDEIMNRGACDEIFKSYKPI